MNSQSRGSARKRAREEEVQRRFPLQLTSFCPVWVSGYDGRFEEPQFTGAVQVHVLDRAKQAREMYRAVGDVVDLPGLQGWDGVLRASGSGMVAAVPGSAVPGIAPVPAVAPVPAPLPMVAPPARVPVVSPGPAQPSIVLSPPVVVPHEINPLPAMVLPQQVTVPPPALPGQAPLPTTFPRIDVPTDAFPSTHQIAACTAFIDTVAQFLQACMGPVSAAGPVPGTAVRTLLSDLSRAFERLRAFQEAITRRLEGIVCSVEEWCGLAEMCMNSMQMWELADQDGSMDPASRDALLRLLERARAASGRALGPPVATGSCFGTSGVDGSVVPTGSLFQDSVNDQLAGSFGSLPASDAGGGVAGILELNTVYADAALRLIAAVPSRSVFDSCSALDSLIRTLLDGLSLMRIGLLKAEHGGQTMLQNVRETFAIVRAAMGYVGNAGGTRGVPDAVPAAGADAGGLVGPIVGGGGGDVLEDMAHLYRMLDVVL